MNPNQPDPVNPVPTPEVNPAFNPQQQTPEFQTPITPEPQQIQPSFQAPTPISTPIASPALPQMPVAPQPLAPPLSVAPTQFTAPQPTPVAPQPVSQPTPIVPNPTTPIGSGPTPNEKPARKKISKTIIISAIVGLVVLAAIGVVLFFMLVKPTKQDFTDAANQYETLTSANAAIDGKVKALSYAVGASSDITPTIKDAEDAINAAKSDSTQLHNLKAVRFGEGQKLYKPYDEKMTKYLTYTASLSDSYKHFTDASKICSGNGATSTAAAFTTLLQDCANSLKDIKGLSNAELQAYATVLADSYQKYATAYTALSLLKDSKSTQYTALQADVTKAGSDIAKANTTFVEATEKNMNLDDLNKDGKALKSYLNEQQKK